MWSGINDRVRNPQPNCTGGGPGMRPRSLNSAPGFRKSASDLQTPEDNSGEESDPGGREVGGLGGCREGRDKKRGEGQSLL